MKPERLRPAAQQDLVALSLWYAEQGGPLLASRLFDVARDALKPIQRMPGLGSPALAESVGMPGLRHWGVDGFPVRWFYLEREDHLDMLRLLCERGHRGDTDAESATALKATRPGIPEQPHTTSNRWP